MPFPGIDGELNSNKHWEILEYYVQVGDAIELHQRVCRVRNPDGCELILFSIHSGTIEKIYAQGRVPIKIKNAAKIEFLLRIKLDT